MNRTQRAIKKANHKYIAQAKRSKRQALSERNEASFFSFPNKAAALKDAVRHEKSLKSWHRKTVQDYAVNNTSKEEKTA